MAQGSGGPKSDNSKQSPTPTPPATGSPTLSPAPSASKPYSGRDRGWEIADADTEPSFPGGETQGASPTPGSEGSPPHARISPIKNGGDSDEQPEPDSSRLSEQTVNWRRQRSGRGKPKGDSKRRPPRSNQKEGEMSRSKRAALLQSMKDEEQKVQLDEHKSMRPVYKDW